MYDVCIVGAGPAGSTLARLLDSRYRVLLVDKRRLDEDPRDGEVDKPCGGLLAPAAQHELARQGLGVPGSVLQGPQLFAVRARDLDSGLERLYQRFYTNVDRARFDRWLASLAAQRAETAFGLSFAGIDRGRHESLVSLRTPAGGRASVSARLVVAADGANSWARRCAFPSSATPSAYVAIQGLFTGPGDEAAFGSFWSRRLTDFYGWTVPKAGRVLAGIALPAGRSAGRFDEFVEALEASGVRLGHEISRSAAPVWRPSTPGQLHLGDERVAVLGEAAGLLSPSSAEGISYALRSAAALATALEPGLDGAAARYRALAAPMVANVTAKLFKSAVVHRAGLRSIVMRTGIGALPEGISTMPAAADLLGI